MSDVSFNIYLIIVLSKVLILFGLFSIWIVWFILHFQLAQCGGTFLFSIRPSYSGRYAYCEMLHLWKAACQPCWAWTRLLQFFSFHFRDIAAAYTWQQCTYTTVDFWIGFTSMRISFILQNLISLHFWSNSMCCLLLRAYYVYPCCTAEDWAQLEWMECIVAIHLLMTAHFLFHTYRNLYVDIIYENE
jgi:hypothetical protein